jgi:hypothetical protein
MSLHRRFRLLLTTVSIASKSSWSKASVVLEHHDGERRAHFHHNQQFAARKLRYGRAASGECGQSPALPAAQRFAYRMW